MSPKSPVMRRLGRAAFALACLSAGIGLGLLVRGLRADPYQQQRQQIAQLAPAEQRELDRNFQRYQRLSEAEQEQLQTFHAQLVNAPDSQELQAVLNNYVNWVRNLSPTQRSELASLADQPQERLARVVEFRRDLLRREPLTRDDIDRVVAWVEAIAAKYPASTENDMEERPEWGDQRRAKLWHTASRLHDRVPDRTLPITEDDFKQLSQQLSPQAQQRLADAATLADKRREVAGWLYLASRRWSGNLRSRDEEEVSEKELVDFFENKLDDARREELLFLPHNARIERLRFLYLRDKYPDRPIGPPGGSRFDGSRFDGPGPGPGTGSGSGPGGPRPGRPRGSEPPFGEPPQGPGGFDGPRGPRRSGRPPEPEPAPAIDPRANRPPGPLSQP